MYNNLLAKAVITTACITIISCNSQSSDHGNFKTDTSVEGLVIKPAQDAQTSRQVDIHNDSKISIKRDKELIEIIEKNIVFDGDFQPSIYLKLRNNAKFSIIGLHIEVMPNKEDGKKSFNEECLVGIQKKVSIASNKIGIIKEKIKQPENQNCNYDYGGLIINGVVYSNGKKLNGIDLLNGDTTLMLNK